MLRLIIPAKECWDEDKEEFVSTKEQTLQLEHSLVSIAKWESKWCKPFLSKENKTFEETIDYIRCMTLTQNVNPDVYGRLTNENIEKINEYIKAPMTATTISDKTNKSSKKEILTAEVIYYLMISFNIPIKCEKWHLNRLLTLIRVFDAKNQPTSKRSVQEIMRENARLNAARRKKLNSKG